MYAANGIEYAIVHRCMGRLLVAEILYPEGHKALDNRLIELLAEENEIDLVDHRDFFKELSCSKLCNTVNIPQFFSNRWEPLISFLYILNYVILAFAIRKKKYDKVFLLSVRNDSLFWVYPLFRHQHLCVFHHNDIDRTLGRPFEKFLFKKLQNRIQHVVLADFIKTGMVSQFHTHDENISVVYQPIIGDIRTRDYTPYFEEEKYIIGLGRSTDEGFLQKLIETDKRYSGRLKYKIIMRSKNIRYSSERLFITTESYSREEYDRIMHHASACIALYTSYNLRYSGIIDDALSAGKLIIGNNIPVFRYFSEKYKGCCHVIDSAQDLFVIASGALPMIKEEMIKRFLEYHSDKNVRRQLNAI